MVPDKFNMVDMGGIDLIMMQEEEVPGLYTRLVESIARCRYQCLYNWLFDGVVIPPTYVELRIGDEDEVIINEGITVTDDDVIHIYSLIIEPVIESLSITENGEYIAPEGIDGYSPINVQVQTGVPVITEEYWDSLTTEEKRALGRIVIQTDDTGYHLGDYVDASLFRPDIEVVSFSAKNVMTSDVLSFTSPSNDSYLIVVAFVQSGSISYANIELNEVSIVDNFTYFYNQQYAHLYSQILDLNAGDTITLTTPRGSGYNGAHLIAIKNASTVTCSGATGNGSAGITLPPLMDTHSRYLNILKYGYYGGNTIPTVNLFYTDESVTTPSIGSESAYWYGGQYVLKLD